METISIEKQKILEAYIKAEPKEQELLEALYGKETFIKPPSGLPRTWEEVCKILKFHPVYSVPYPNTKDKEEKAINAFFILSKIREVLNTDSSGKVWEPDWSNDKEYKYWPWFRYTAEVGFSFDATDYVCTATDYVCTATDYVCTATDVGSRLCFKTSEFAEHSGKAFIKYYRDFLTTEPTL